MYLMFLVQILKLKGLKSSGACRDENAMEDGMKIVERMLKTTN